ncbi:hypothetical protein OK18_04905 [Chryseobacterium gallinarum]|uniref:Trimeric autotransporter adhesin YadA-like head domain-containing protein n=2 Tax=Chryseobacterium gallinarum TaxID=1324352 RepID=A0A0G3M0D2_CHRGL|nr:hypothetical protein OK18_04905 [Chryseobacterium gallinarum]
MLLHKKTTNIIKMKNKLFTFALLSASSLSLAQVGINTGLPSATLDVTGFPAMSSKLDGIIAPRLTGAELRAKTYTSAQTGAIVYVTLAESAPAGQTVDVVAPGYYYFDGTKWGSLSADWRILGNTGTIATTAPLGSDVTSGNYLGTNDGQNIVLVTQKNVKGILDVNGTLQGGNANSATGPFASFTWGSNNVLANSTSSNIALGKDNTVSAQGNFPAVAIGLGNKATNGAKIIGNSNTASGANNLVLGNSNTITGIIGVTVGNSNTNNGGIIFGTGNTASSNNIAIGSGNTASGIEAIAIGVSTQAAAGQTAYGNTAHVFTGKNGAVTDVGINMTPSAANFADLEVSKAIQIRGVASPANAACATVDEGAIRYNTTTKTHEGCNGSNWKPLY